MVPFPSNAVVLFFKAEQFGLFGASTPVKGYVHPKTGKWVTSYTGIRHRKLQKPDHPMSEHLFAQDRNEIARSPATKTPAGLPVSSAGKTAPQKEATPRKLIAFPKNEDGDGDSGDSGGDGKKKPAPQKPINFALDYNLPKGTITGGANELRQLFNQAKTGERQAVRFQVVEHEEAKKLKAVTGLDVLGFKHTVDNSAILKIKKDHGAVESEAPRGQEPITEDDVARIPDIINHYDSVESVGQDEMGNELIRYSKRYNGVICYVEEVRNKRWELAAKTLWKNRARVSMPGSKEPSPDLRPERLGGNPPQVDFTLLPSTPKDKEDPAPHNDAPSSARALAGALQRGDVPAALAVLRPLSFEDARDTVLYAGFSISTVKSKTQLIAHLQNQLLASIRQAKTSQTEPLKKAILVFPA